MPDLRYRHMLHISLLPSSPESFVELNQRQQLAEPDLSQTQFSIKQVAVSIQGIEECIDSAPVPHVGHTTWKVSSFAGRQSLRLSGVG